MADEALMRAAAMQAIERLCANEDVPVPELEEETEWKGAIRITRFIGEMPDGRRFWIGYEMKAEELVHG
jgi:hypothetical protein